MAHMPDQTFRPGDETYFASDSLTPPHSASFEDDGETGYFYALDLTRSENMILDALHIYNVANILDPDRTSTLAIIWSSGGTKCALLINGYPHAAFDFVARRGYCRTNFPNVPNTSPLSWENSNHQWSDEAIEWLK